MDARTQEDIYILDRHLGNISNIINVCASQKWPVTIWGYSAELVSAPRDRQGWRREPNVQSREIKQAATGWAEVNVVLWLR